jgi:hypothetical protein
MHNMTHQWTMFQKGRLKIKACAYCGEMSLPSNSHSLCDKTDILSSPIMKAGYTLATDVPTINQTPQRVVA